jgi:heme exporter protein CcmD
MSEFLAMSGYAAYVWPSIGIAIAALLLNIYWARRLMRLALSEARRRMASGGAS